MSFLLRDRKKLATLIMEGERLKKKPLTEDGAEKDRSNPQSEQGQRLLEALTSQDGNTVVDTLRSFVKSVLDESTDDSPSPETPSSEEL